MTAIILLFAVSLASGSSLSCWAVFAVQKQSSSPGETPSLAVVLQYEPWTQILILLPALPQHDFWIISQYLFYPAFYYYLGIDMPLFPTEL